MIIINHLLIILQLQQIFLVSKANSQINLKFVIESKIIKKLIKIIKIVDNIRNIKMFYITLRIKRMREEKIFSVKLNCI